jgi:hypothetical protein
MGSAPQIRPSSNGSQAERGAERIVRRAPLALRAAFWISIAIALAVVVRRVFAIAFPSPSGPPQLAALDTSFASHAALTLAHILPAAVFVLLTPVVLLRAPGRSPWAERTLYVLGAVVGLTALAMSRYPIGGWIEQATVWFFDGWFLVALYRAWRLRREGRREDERRWLLRAVVVLFGIATTRPVMGVFFATSRMTHLTPNQFFGVAFWIGFSINALAIELWLRSRRHAQANAEKTSLGG